MRWRAERRGGAAGALARLALLLALVLSDGALAQQPQPQAQPAPQLQTLPFAQALDLRALHAATRAAPGDLLTTLRHWGVAVWRVRSVPPRPPNPLLAALPEAPADLLARAEFADTYDGRLVCSTPEGCARGRDAVLIRDSALGWTLIHEFVQSQLRPLRPGDPDPVVEQRFGSAFRRLQLYQRRLYDDPYRLLDPRWRRDILSAQADVAADLFDRIRLGQSQEVIVEALLARHIDAASPYFDADRRDQGRRYAERMLQNAADITDALADSVYFVEATVRQLRRALVERDLEPGPGESLTDADVAVVEHAVAAGRPLLQRVRAELQALQQLQP